MHKQLITAIQHSENAFKYWKNISFQERQKLFPNLATHLKLNKDRFAKIITDEMHKPITQSRAEIEKSALMTNFYAHAENVLAPQKIEVGLSISEVHYQPLGIVLGVMPWNFPFWQTLRFAVPTILAGNVVILKHASICYESGDAIEKLFLDAGFPEAVFQHLKISHDEVEEVINDSLIKGVSLTGSEVAGSKVASLAGKNIKKSILELGGNDAFIVLEDADWVSAAKDGALSRLQNCGQTCVAAKRFIVHEKIYDDFLAEFIREYQKFEVGNPFDEATKLGSMAREDLADELEKQYQMAIAHGAEIILPLERLDEISFRPGLLKMNEGNPVLDEELFGPLGMILKAKNDEEILQIANNTKFGLANSVWTKNKERALFFAKNLESGTVSINQLTKSDPRLPFGGTKKSGYGVELSLQALKEFTIAKTYIGNI